MGSFSLAVGFPAQLEINSFFEPRLFKELSILVGRPACQTEQQTKALWGNEGRYIFFFALLPD